MGLNYASKHKCFFYALFCLLRVGGVVGSIATFYLQAQRKCSTIKPEHLLLLYPSYFPAQKKSCGEGKNMQFKLVQRACTRVHFHFNAPGNLSPSCHISVLSSAEHIVYIDLWYLTIATFTHEEGLLAKENRQYLMVLLFQIPRVPSLSFPESV